MKRAEPDCPPLFATNVQVRTVVVGEVADTAAAPLGDELFLNVLQR